MSDAGFCCVKNVSSFPAECLAKAHIIDDAWLAKKENREAIDQWTKFYEEEKDAAGRKKYPLEGFVVDDPKPK